MKNNWWYCLVGGLCSLAIFTLTGRASADDLVQPMNLHILVSGSPTAPDCGTLPSRQTLICYSPEMIRAAYNYPVSFMGIPLNGTGQTIAILDAYGSPTILPSDSPNYVNSDLAKFDREFEIPDPPTLTILCPAAGCPVFNPGDTQHDEVGWAMETSLDVEWAHAAAPGANIVLVVAATSAGTDINTALQTAVNLSDVSVISQSFGRPESQIPSGNSEVAQAHANYEAAQTNRITVLASTGNRGATNGPSSQTNATYPASDPLVTAVGGTEGDPYPSGLYASGGYGGEQVWNEADSKDGIIGATGGAPSLLFPVPTFQDGLGLTSRTIPDVSYNAAWNGGVLVYVSALGGSTVGFYVMGGTGASAPQWAGIVAMANQMRALMGNKSLGYINPAIYTLAQGADASNDFHDITIGNNGFLGTYPGFQATTGYDAASGWGTPNVANLVPDLANAVP
jgi:subtilase family serine protease